MGGVAPKYTITNSFALCIPVNWSLNLHIRSAPGEVVFFFHKESWNSWCVSYYNFNSCWCTMHKSAYTYFNSKSFDVKTVEMDFLSNQNLLGDNRCHHNKKTLKKNKLWIQIIANGPIKGVYYLSKLYAMDQQTPWQGKLFVCDVNHQMPSYLKNCMVFIALWLRKFEFLISRWRT